MINSFKQFLTEKIRKIPFVRLPKIGWWLDGEKITCYHGTHIRNIEWIEKNGLVPPEQGYTAGVVSLALEPNTSWGYASMSAMGGESGRGIKADKGSKGFRDAGAGAKSTPQEERVVFVLEFPKKYLMSKILPINYTSSDKKLNNRSEYDKWERTDQEYYAITELKFKGTVPAKYIKSYMTK